MDVPHEGQIISDDRELLHLRGRQCRSHTRKWNRALRVPETRDAVCGHRRRCNRKRRWENVELEPASGALVLWHGWPGGRCDHRKAHGGNRENRAFDKIGYKPGGLATDI